MLEAYFRRQYAHATARAAIYERYASESTNREYRQQMHRMAATERQAARECWRAAAMQARVLLHVG